MGKCCSRLESQKQEEQFIYQIFNSLYIKKLNGDALYKEFLKIWEDSLKRKAKENCSVSSESPYLALTKYDNSSNITFNVKHNNTNSANTNTQGLVNTESTDLDSYRYTYYYSSALFESNEEKDKFINKLLYKSNKAEESPIFNNGENCNEGDLSNNNSTLNEYYEQQYKYLKQILDQPKQKASRQIGNFIILNSKFISYKKKQNYLIYHLLNFYGKEDKHIRIFLNDIVEMNTTILLKSMEDVIQYSEYYEMNLWNHENKEKLLNSLFKKFNNCRKTLDINDTTKIIPQGLENDSDINLLSREFRKKARKSVSKIRDLADYKEESGSNSDSKNLRKNKSFSNLCSQNIGFLFSVNNEKENHRKNKIDVKVLSKKRFEEDKEIISKKFIIENFDLLEGGNIRKALFEMSINK